MAEGGYDPETTTNPFDPHGDDHDVDTTPLIPHEETGMKHRTPFISHPSQRPRPKTSTSTSGEHETSFIDTTSAEVHVDKHLQEARNIEEKLRKELPNIKFGSFKMNEDKHGRIFISLFAKNSVEYLLYDIDEKVVDLKKIRKASKTLRIALGRTRIEINNEAYGKQKEEEDKLLEKERIRQDTRTKLAENDDKMIDAIRRKDNLREVIKEQEEAIEHALTPEDKESHTKTIETTKISYRQVSKEVDEFAVERNRLEQVERDADEIVQQGVIEVETARERVNQRLLSLRDRIKEIFKKHGFTVVAVTTAIGVVIGVIVSNLKAGLTKVAKGVGNGLKELGAKLGQILPGMVGAIASFIFKTAGEVIGFLAKNAWLLIVGLVVLAVEQFKKRSR